MAIRLAIPAYGLAAVAPAFFVWQSLFLGAAVVLSGAAGVEDILFVLALFSVPLLLGALWFLFWAGAYALLLRLLWSSPPKWLRLPQMSTLVNRDFGVLVSATLPLAITFLLQVGMKVSLRHRFPSFSSLRLSYETFLLESFWLWFISAVFLYHGYYLTRARARRRKRSKRSASA